MRGQPEIIVRGEVDDLLAVEGALRRLLVLENAQAEMRALGFEFVDLVGEISKRIGASRSGHENLERVIATNKWANATLIRTLHKTLRPVARCIPSGTLMVAAVTLPVVQ